MPLRRFRWHVVALALAAAGCVPALRGVGPGSSDDGAAIEGFEPLGTVDVTVDSLALALETTTHPASGEYRVCAVVAGAAVPWCLGPFTADDLGYEARMDRAGSGAVVLVLASPRIVAAEGLTRVELVPGVANGWVGVEPAGAGSACLTLSERGGHRVEVEVALTSSTAVHAARCFGDRP